MSKIINLSNISYAPSWHLYSSVQSTSFRSSLCKGLLFCSLIFLTFIVNRYLAAYRIQCFCYFMLKLWRYRFLASGFHFCCWAVSSQPNCPSFVIIYILSLATLRASFHIWETAFSQCCVWYGFLYIYLLFLLLFIRFLESVDCLSSILNNSLL